MDKEIRAVVRPPSFENTREYFSFMEKELLAAGVPIEGEILLHGTLNSFENPEDSSVEIWVWKPAESGLQTS